MVSSVPLGTRMLVQLWKLAIPKKMGKNMRFATVAFISIFIGCLGAQTSQTETRTAKTTTTAATNPVDLNGTLFDQNCYTTHFREQETNTNQNTTTTTVTTKVSTDCPVTASTTTYALMTPDGRIVRFDADSNREVRRMMKSEPGLYEEMKFHRPIQVHVVAMPNGDVMVIKEIKPD